MLYRSQIATIILCSFLLDMLACTGIRLKSDTGGFVYGRTLEFGENLESELLVIPRGYQFAGTGPTGKTNGLKWHAKYAVVGANAFGLTHIIDGINEKNLAGGLFYFPEYAQYQKVSPDQASQSLASWELLSWILTNFATVKEVAHALPRIKVSSVPLAEYHAIQPLHAIIHDAQGNSLVIEYINGKLYMHDNPIGILTNSPTFDWHITNLRNYVNLTNSNVPKIKLADITLTPFGQGSGMLGLPGDFTPPSRFVRAAAFTRSALRSRDQQDAVHMAFHILNLFDIPKGIVRESKNDLKFDYTQWTSVCDLKNKKFYFHTYNNRQIRVVDLDKLAHTSKKLVISMHTPGKILDITPGTHS